MNVIIHEIYSDEVPEAHGAELKEQDILTNQSASKWLDNVLFNKYFDDNADVILNADGHIITISDDYFHLIRNVYYNKEKVWLQKPGYRTDEYVIIPFDYN